MTDAAPLPTPAPAEQAGMIVEDLSKRRTPEGTLDANAPGIQGDGDSVDPTADAEDGWERTDGKVIAARLGGGRLGWVAATVIDGTVGISARISRASRRWNKMPSERKVGTLCNLAFWLVCAAVVGAMWYKARRETLEVMRAREYAIKGSCSVCMDNSGIDISKPCKPVTAHDLTTHRDKLAALLAVVTKHIADGHQSITAASAGSRACLVATSHAPGGWRLPGMRETLVMYNPVEVDPYVVYDDEREVATAAVDPLLPREQETTPTPPEQQQPPAVVRVKLPEPESPKPAAQAITISAPPAEKIKITTVVYKEPSDFFPGAVIERKRPSTVKVRYWVVDQKGDSLKVKYVVLGSFEAACVINGIEVLNGTHYELYHPRNSA